MKLDHLRNLDGKWVVRVRHHGNPISQRVILTDDPQEAAEAFEDCLAFDAATSATTPDVDTVELVFLPN